MNGVRIISVDDDYLIRWSLRKYLEKAGYVVFLAESGEEALQIIRKEAPVLALLDITLPGMDGFEVLERALEINQSLIPIMVTAQDDADQMVRATRLGAFDYITKPFDLKEVRQSIEKALVNSK